jgi:hypothetical protein
MWQVIGLAVLLQGVCPNIWIDKTHDDFQAGQEFFPVQTKSIRDCWGSELRTWELGAYWWSPHDGGLRILRRDIDLDDNGFKDVIVSQNDGSSEIRLFWNYGDSFATRYTSLSTAPLACIQAIEVADVNCDGHADLLVGAGCWSSTSYIFHGTEDPKVFTRTSLLSDYADYGSQEVVPIDINGDGYLDLWMAGNNKVYVLYGPDLSYREPDRIIEFPGAGYTHHAVFADVDYDHKLDVVIPFDHGDNVIIAFGPEFTRTVELPAPEAFDVSVCDLNRDGYLDILVDAQGCDYVYQGSPQGYSPARRTQLPGEPEGECAVEDLNNDGVPDLALGEIGSWAPGNSYIRFGPDYQRSVTLPGGCVSLADWNNDGWKDVLFWFYNGGAKLFWNRSGSFSASDYQLFDCMTDDGIVEDYGNLWDRSNRERFLSRVIDILPGDHEAPKNDSADCCFRVGVYGNLPEGMAVSVEVRSSLGGRRWTRWYRPVGDVPDGAIAGGDIATFGRFFQYRLVTELDYSRTTLFRVDSVKAFIGNDDTKPLPRLDVSARPAQDEFRVVGNAVALNLTGRARLTVSDITGRTLSEQSLGAGSYQIPVASTQGVYVVRFESGGRRVTRKVVVSQ